MTKFSQYLEGFFVLEVWTLFLTVGRKEKRIIFVTERIPHFVFKLCLFYIVRSGLKC